MQHLDEGTIHAWLDGALTADEAARVEQHRHECVPCAAMVAEARGLVAGASRILSALDDVPAVVPGGGRGAGGGAPRLEEFARLRPPSAAPRPLWSRPAVLAAAASVVLMAGSALVVSNVDRGLDGGPAAGRNAELPQPVADSAGRGAEAAATTGNVEQSAPARDGGVGAANAPRRSVAARLRLPGGTASGTPTEMRRRAAPPSSERIAEVAPREGVAQKAAVSEKIEPVAPPAPAPSDVPSRLADVARAPSADAPVTQRATEARRAVTQRSAAARARNERAMPSAGAAQPTEMVSRGDTSYRLRVDTVTVTQTDTVTVVVESPRPPGLRDAPIPLAIIRISGCYEVLEGRLPKVITLTTTRMWSGAAEQQFVAKASRATGYWSQPPSGDVHLVIDGALATARIHPSSGELRGKVHRGGKSEQLVARRCR